MRLYSIAAAAVLIYLPFLVVAYGRAQVGYDRGAPRAMFDRLPDYAKRATWAHQNSFETFTIYAAAASMPALMQPAPTRRLLLWQQLSLWGRGCYTRCFIF